MLNPKLVFDIRLHVRRFADGDISLAEFRSWFVEADQRAQFGALSGKADPEAVALTDEIMVALSDFDDGLLDGLTLRQVLRLIESVPRGTSQLRSRDTAVAHIYARPASALVLSHEFVSA